MKLKLRPVMLLLVFLPVILITAVALIVSYISTNQLVMDELENTMEGTAHILRTAYENGHPGEYYMNEDGEVFKGDYNISADTDIVDGIKVADGHEATFFWGDTRVMTTIRDEKTNERIIGTKTSDPNVLQKVLKDGQSFFNENLIINGDSYYVLYYPVFQEGSTKDVVGMVFIGILRTSVTESINRTTISILIAIASLVVIDILLSLYLINNVIKAIKKTCMTLDAMADGDISVSVDEKNLKRVDEAGEMSRSLDKLIGNLRDSLSSIVEQSKELGMQSDSLHKTADETSNTVGQVESAINDIATGATSQAEDTTQAAEHVSQMGNLISETMKEVEELKSNSDLMTGSSKTAMDILQELKEINKRASEAIDIIYKQTNITNESSLKIREATSLITSIAAETNLLSLNASIEAARAGEQGRGFAVVAGQIQKLAEQSNNSASEIDAIINSLIMESNKSVQVMKEVREVIDRQSEKVDKTSEAFSEVKSGINASRESVENINGYFVNLDEARVSVIDIIQNLTAIAEQNAASAEETSAATTEVSASVENVAGLADSLKDVITVLEESTDKFKL